MPPPSPARPPVEDSSPADEPFAAESMPPPAPVVPPTGQAVGGSVSLSESWDESAPAPAPPPRSPSPASDWDDSEPAPAPPPMAAATLYYPDSPAAEAEAPPSMPSQHSGAGSDTALSPRVGAKSRELVAQEQEMLAEQGHRSAMIAAAGGDDVAPGNNQLRDARARLNTISMVRVNVDRNSVATCNQDSGHAVECMPGFGFVEQNENTANQTFNLGTGKMTNLMELKNLIADIMEVAAHNPPLPRISIGFLPALAPGILLFLNAIFKGFNQV